MRKTAILLMLITMVSKLLGFGREIILSYFYGASNISDAYLISLTITMVVFNFIGTGISTGYIPMYSMIEQKLGKQKGNRFTNNLVNIVLCICTIVIFFGFAFTGCIVKVFASGFTGETLTLAIKFTRISLFGIYFTCLIYIFTGFLQVKDNYVLPSLIGLPFNLLIILSIFISSKSNILILSIGSVIASVSQLLLLIPFIYRKGYEYKFVLDIKDEHIKNMVSIVLPVIIGVAVNEINVLIDRNLASTIAVGGISALSYANKLIWFIQGLFVTSIVTVMYPMISKMAAEKNLKGMMKIVSEAINLVNILIIPATIGAMLFAEPIVKLLFGRGAFDVQAISMTSEVLFFYSIGMIGYGLREVLSRGFYSLQDTKTPMINGIIAVVLNIILNLLLSKYMGVSGLALATSISAIICTCLLFISLRRKIGPFGIKNIIISFLKILIASLIMGAIAKLSYNILLNNSSANLTLIISIGIGVFTYFTLIYFMRIDEVDTMVDLIKRKLKEKLSYWHV